MFGGTERYQRQLKHSVDVNYSRDFITEVIDLSLSP